MPSKKCELCKESYVIGVPNCPHCGRPSFFPNVQLAGIDEEVHALNERYQTQVLQLQSAGKTLALSDVKSAIDAASACKAMRRYELERLIDSDTATAATYYQQIQGKSRIPDDNCWDRLRRIADASFLVSFGSDVHFAALSTQGRWLTNYGDGAVFFKAEMIAHRATLFEKNTAVWVNETNGDLTIPLGHRALWDDRYKLVVAKLGNDVVVAEKSFDELLLSCGATSATDAFVEVHIYGSFTVRSVASIITKRGAISDLGRASLLERMTKLNINFSELP